ncbi:MAG: GNAT family N-acetyltransferase [Lacisediminihabitans sp.]
MTEQVIRPYSTRDRASCYDVCVTIGAAGGDARGLYSSDDLLPDIFCGPYLDLDPSSAFVVESGDRVAGYIIAASDTRHFVRRYRREVLPGFAAKYPFVEQPLTPEDVLVNLGNTPEHLLIAELDEYPAHLHIDLLPELQGLGMGRRLIETLLGSLSARGIGGVHLAMDGANSGARAFYDRLGFLELTSSTPEQPVLGVATS